MDFQEQIASEIDITVDQVRRVIEAFARETHRTFYERRVDPYAQIYWSSSNMAFFHMLGLLKLSAEQLGGEFHPEEYLLRMGQREDWELFSDQMNDWERPGD